NFQRLAVHPQEGGRDVRGGPDWTEPEEHEHQQTRISRHRLSSVPVCPEPPATRGATGCGVSCLPMGRVPPPSSRQPQMMPVASCTLWRANFERFVFQCLIPMAGSKTPFTRALTTLPNAAPTMRLTAKSSTLPHMATSLNSFHIAFLFPAPWP